MDRTKLHFDTLQLHVGQELADPATTRLSIGTEHIDDLLSDLTRVFAQV